VLPAFPLEGEISQDDIGSFGEITTPLGKFVASMFANTVSLINNETVFATPMVLSPITIPIKPIINPTTYIKKTAVKNIILSAT
jgi:hypothetical protein